MAPGPSGLAGVLALPGRIRRSLAWRLRHGLHYLRAGPAAVWRRLTRYRPTADGVRIRVPGVGWVAMRLHPSGDNFISAALRLGELQDPHVLAVLRGFTRPGDTVLDVGANIGWFSVIASRLVGPRGTVFAIEPDPLNADLLRDNLLRNSCANVIVEQVAAGGGAGTARLYHSADNAGDHQMAIIADRPSWVDVAVLPLDTLMAGRAQRLDVLKMDTQGSEAAALRGMAGLLARHPRLRLVLEFWPHGLERCGSSAAELLDLLDAAPRRYWLMENSGRISPTDIAALRHRAATDFAPETVMHADIVVVATSDAEAIAVMARLESR